MGELQFGPRPTETVFGQRLADLRAERGLTIMMFALHCRVSQRSMESWIHDGAEPLLGYAYKVACALGVDIDDMADPALTGVPRRQRPDAPAPWTFDFKGAVCSTQFGATLRLAMHPRTIVDFARDLGLSRVTVNDWTLAKTEPRLTSAMRAAAELGVSLHGLCDGRVEWRSP